ncbi:hypothetical protein [Spirosoma koreense]
MKKVFTFWKRRFSTRTLEMSTDVFSDVIGEQEAQKIRGGDKEYMPVYDTHEKSALRTPSILLDFM